MAFLDEEEGTAPPEVPERPRRPENGPRRRRQQYLVRRLIGVGIGLGFLILVVLAFRGCLEARKERGMTNYVTDAGTIMSESQEAGSRFFELLEGGSSSPVELENEIRLLRGASAQLLERANNLDAPDQMSDADGALTRALALRRDALERIADNIGPASAEAETEDAITTITRQMAALYSSDVLYAQVAVPGIRQVLQEEEVSAPALPPGNFMPSPDPSSTQNTEWLAESGVRDALASISGENLGDQPRGLALIQVAIGDTTLDPESTNTLSEAPSEIAVDVQNQGAVEESGVEVEVSVAGQEPVTSTISALGPGETRTVNLQLPPLEAGSETTIEVVVVPVSGEEDSSNNEASYSVAVG